NWVNKEEKELPIPFWYPKVWNDKYKPYFYLLNDKFVYHFFSLLYCTECPKVSDSVREPIGGIGDWYLEKEYSYIRLYGFDSALHHLPKYA
ncbi:hypothetical protein, partial [Salmonella sp. SAL4446]|uniref:hypothetical protein n=1 Tax=Salmonella sp. SAL4446 TaxID=3159901 RepID=UPI00397BBE21